MRRNKYNAQRTEAYGLMFASKAEAKRYCELRILLTSGEIFELECQPKFKCVVNGAKVCNYIADFRYTDRATGEVVTEDVKGVKTPVYKLKKKLVEAIYGITITEIGK